MNVSGHAIPYISQHSNSRNKYITHNQISRSTIDLSKCGGNSSTLGRRDQSNRFSVHGSARRTIREMDFQNLPFPLSVGRSSSKLHSSRLRNPLDFHRRQCAGTSRSPDSHIKAERNSERISLVIETPEASESDLPSPPDGSATMEAVPVTVQPDILESSKRLMHVGFFFPVPE